MSPRKSEKRTENKKKIINSAIKLISKKGVEGTSLSLIAKEAGISKGTLYYYYPTKNDLIFDITEVHINKISNDIFGAIDKNRDGLSLKETLIILFEKLLNSEARTRMHIYLIKEVLGGNNSIKKRFIEIYNQWFSLVVEGYKRVSKTQLNLTVEPQILVAAIDGFIIQSILETSKINIELIVEKLLYIIEDQQNRL